MEKPIVLIYSFLIIVAMVTNMCVMGSIIYKMNFDYNGYQTNFLDVYGDDSYWQCKALKFRKTMISNIRNIYIPVIVITSLFLIMSLAVN